MRAKRALVIKFSGCILLLEIKVKNISEFEIHSTIKMVKHIGCLSSNHSSVVPPRKSKRLKLQTAT
jgi:hypothetical protein